MWNLKKGPNELLCRTDRDSQTWKNLRFPNETGWEVGECAWDSGWKCYKIGFDNCCTTINIIKFIE